MKNYFYREHQNEPETIGQLLIVDHYLLKIYDYLRVERV